MPKTPYLLALVALFSTAPITAQPVEPPAQAAAPSPNEIVAAAAPEEWVAIAPHDLLVMALAPAANGEERRVVIQLMPPPFSQGWVSNIRTLAAAHWWDGTSINRVQDNYVVQWGDPAAEEADARALPEGLAVMDQRAYTSPFGAAAFDFVPGRSGEVQEPLGDAMHSNLGAMAARPVAPEPRGSEFVSTPDPYASLTGFDSGWPLASDGNIAWPVHCYGMVGVGRGYSPDTGTGAELYTVIGHAPRHLDRNIALVGRVVEGMEHLSSLRRGKGDLGFYDDETRRVPIASIRLASALPSAEQPRFEYLSTASASFAAYAEARANRRDPFFIVPAGGADICNVPVPVRRTGAE